MTNRGIARRRPRGMYPKAGEMRQSSGRNRRNLPEYLDFNEVQALIHRAPSFQASLVMLIQWRAGLRVSEALALEVADLSLNDDHPTLRVRKGKGNKARQVPIHPELAAAFRNVIGYTGVRSGRFVEASRGTAWRWLKAALADAQKAGDIAIGKPVGTHTLRHSCARHWLASGIPINTVSRWLGHAALGTTLIYLEILPDPLGEIERVP